MSAPMSADGHSLEPLAVGVDIGGTWMRALALRGGRAVGRVTRPAERGADPPRLLAALWRRRGWGPRSVAALVVAARGVWTWRERAALSRRLAGLARRVHAMSDAEAAALGALGGAPGVLILAGTGSIALGRDARGGVRRAGGLGPLLGDEGSAFWVAARWLRITDPARARRLARGPEAVRRIATLAPRVLARARRGDRVARAIVREAQEGLAAHAVEVARGLRLAEPVLVSWAGGMMADAWFRAGVRRALARRGVRSRWRAPATDTVSAAAMLAARLVARSRSERRRAAKGGRP